MFLKSLLIALIGGFYVSTIAAQEESSSFFSDWEVTGFGEAESRVFFEKPLDSRQFDHFDGSLAGEIEFYRAWEEPELEFTLKPFLRLDIQDSERSHFDLREMMLSKVADQWELRGGVGKVFWGVTESQHLVDTINQTDLVENIDGEEKLGQPMVNFTWITDGFGNFNFFYLPYFRERTFPGTDGRLRSSPRVDADRPIFESGAENWHPDFAARWSTYFGAFDIGLHYFYGTSRDPLFTPETLPSGETILRPTYNLMHQGGLDAQWTHEGWLLKLEALGRTGKGQHYAAFVSGFEYTFYGLFESNFDLGVLGEYHYDDRGDEALSLFNNDVFSGFRLTPNDAQDTAFLAGVFWDHKTDSTSLRAEFERRLGSNYFLEVQAQGFANSDPGDLAYVFRNDSFLTVSIRRYF